MCVQKTAEQMEQNMTYSDIGSRDVRDNNSKEENIFVKSLDSSRSCSEMDMTMAEGLNLIRNEVASMKQLIIEMNAKIERPEVKPDDELWTVNQVASYLHKSKGTIQSHYQGKAGFPRSKKIGNARYWKPAEIIAYAKKDKAY